MASYLKKYWFFVGIAVVVMIAFVVPAVGVFVKTHNILTIVIFLGFLITGLTLETASIGEQFKNVRVLSAALISCAAAFPGHRLFFGAPGLRCTAGLGHRRLDHRRGAGQPSPRGRS